MRNWNYIPMKQYQKTFVIYLIHKIHCVLFKYLLSNTSRSEYQKLISNKCNIK